MERRLSVSALPLALQRPDADLGSALDRFFLTTSKDMTGRLYTLYPVEGYRPKTFSGHRDAVLNAYFSADNKTVRRAESGAVTKR